MGCFLGCFGHKKDRKRQTQRYKVTNQEGRQRQVSQNVIQASAFPEEQVILEKPQSPVVELSVKHEEQLSLNNKKRVTFDSNIKTYEHIPVNESTESLLEKEKEEAFSSLARSQSQMLPRSNSEDDSIYSSVGSYPQNHRYQNCQESDDEFEDSENEESDFDDEDNNYGDDDDEEDCGDDYEASMETIGTEGYTRDKSEFIHHVLNPVENLSQWKAAKAKKTIMLSNPQKENFSFHFQTPKAEKNQKTGVDASLSNWLTSSEVKISSERSLSQESAVTSLRSLEDRPIIGSVGSYWSHSSSAEDSGSVTSYKGRPNATSKYRGGKCQMKT